MNNINNIILLTSAANKYKSIKEQIKAVMESNLTQKEKESALNSHNKFIKTTFIYIIVLTLIFGITFGYTFYINNLLISIILMIIYLILILLYIPISKLIFKDWYHYLSLVSLGFDGKTEEEIDKLKPDSIDLKMIKSYEIKLIFINILTLVCIASLIYICVISNKFNILSPIFIILTIIVVVIYIMEEDDCKVEIKRLNDGFYKTNVAYLCNTCRSRVEVSYNDLKNSELKNGKRIVKCKECMEDVYISNDELITYEKYLKKREKYENK